MSSRRFQRWATAFPLTRPIARRESRALFDLCAGFVYSQVLFACVQLRLFEVLGEGPQDVADLARRLALPPEAMRCLLEAADSLRLVSRVAGGDDSDRFMLGPLGAAMAGNPGIAAMIDHHALLYSDLRDPAALLRGAAASTALAGYWPYAGAERPADLDDGAVAAYSALMAASQPMIADQVLAAYPLARHRCLLDVGGGEGAFLTAVAAAAPKLGLMLFDLPAVATRAERCFEAAGLEGRVACHGGDVFRDPLPTGADIISLVRVIHDHDDDSALAILSAVRRALPRDGTLLLAEPMAGTAGAEPSGAAYFGFYLLAMGRGRPRSAHALQALLKAAGFGRSRLIANHNPLLTRVLVAQVKAA
ncbi:MAG: methyltransferase [Kiloniellaceae bacterium]